MPRATSAMLRGMLQFGVKFGRRRSIHWKICTCRASMIASLWPRIASVRSLPMTCFVPTIVALTKTYLIHKRSVPTSK